MPAIDQYLTQILERNGSDLHFLAGDPPRVRQYGDLKSLSDQPLSADTVKSTLYEIMPKISLERFEAKDGCDFAYTIPGVARFRVNVMRQLNGMGGGISSLSKICILAPSEREDADIDYTFAQVQIKEAAAQ